MKYLIILLMTAVTSLTTGCAATDTDNVVKYEKDSDPRVGDSVDRVCFNRSITGWSNLDNDNNALLVHFGVNRSYKVKLVGMCEANWAMARIAVVSKQGSSCMSVGDKIVTDAQMNSVSSCTITEIFEWHKQSNKETTTN